MFFRPMLNVFVISSCLFLSSSAYALKWSNKTDAIMSIDNVTLETLSERYAVYVVTWTAKQTCRQFFSFGRFVSKDEIELAKNSIEKFNVRAGDKFRDRIPIFNYEKGGDLILDDTSCFNN